MSDKKIVTTKSTKPAVKAAPASYMDRITFDPTMWKMPLAGFITNIRLVLLLVLTIVFLGTVSYFNLPKRLNPEVEIPIVSVLTVLPGASPDDVESLVTVPLENELKGVEGVDTFTSVSTQNVSSITLQFFSNIDSEKAKSDVQSIIDGVSDLPEDALDSSVIKFDFENQPIWTFALTSKTDDVPSLMTFSSRLQDVIEEHSKVDRVNVLGVEQQEIVIEADTSKIAEYNLNPLQLSGLIQAAVPSYPAGSVSTGSNAFSLTIDPTVTSLEQLRQLQMSVAGNTIQLGDIATVRERSKIGQRIAYFLTPDTTPARAVTFNVYKTKTANITDAASEVVALVEEEMKSFDESFEIHTIVNTGEEVEHQFTDLLGEFRTTILLVFGCLLLFLGLRQAFLASLTVPLTFLSAFVFMNLTGMSINFLSLFAFLLALGLLVDDSIVVVSAMTSYFKTKKFTPAETGLMVWRDTIVPIWSTTITTIWSFAPLLLSTGIIGEFIKPIPIVVTAVMISSTAIAVLITLPFMIVLLRPQLAGRVVTLLKVLAFIATLAIMGTLLRSNPLLPIIVLLYIAILLIGWRVRKSLITVYQQKISSKATYQNISARVRKYSDKGVINLQPLEHWYHNLILKVLKSRSSRLRVVAAGVVFMIVAFALLPLGLVKNEFFPKTDGNQLNIAVELPSGTTLDRTQAEATSVVEQVKDTPELDFVVVEIGSAMDMSGFGGSSENTNAFTITLHLTPFKEREMTSIEIAEQLREEFKQYSAGTLSVVEPSGGPPAGADVQIELRGENLGQLDQYADQVVQHLSTQPGINSAKKSIKPGTSAVVFVPDQQKILESGLSTQQLGLWLRTFASGFTLDSINFESGASEKKDVVFRVSEGQASIDELSSILIPTPTGNVTLANLGYFETKANPVSITRADGRRTVTITAGVGAGYSISQKNQDLIDYVKNMDMAEGYIYQTGGVNEENEKSVQSILQAMVVSFILILVTMVIQFGSYRQAIIVLMVIPLAVSSVFYAFALTGTPLSFPALIGVLSLFGIVVTNSMFIVDKINLNIREGMAFNDAIADAGSSRLEPIILTKLCTVLGLLPITLADPLWRGLGGAIISGLLLASTIMLLFIPVVYYMWFSEESSRK